MVNLPKVLVIEETPFWEKFPKNPVFFGGGVALLIAFVCLLHELSQLHKKIPFMVGSLLRRKLLKLNVLPRVTTHVMADLSILTRRSNNDGRG